MSQTSAANKVHESIQSPDYTISSPFNCILQIPPLSDVDLAAVRQLDSEDMASKIKGGKPKHCADFPVSRGFGPLFPIYGLDGIVVPECDNRHPYGPQKRKYERDDSCDGLEDDEYACGSGEE